MTACATSGINVGSQFELFDLDCTYLTDTCRVWLCPFTVVTFGKFANMISCDELNYSMSPCTQHYLFSPADLPSSLDSVPACSLISSSVLSRNEPSNWNTPLKFTVVYSMFFLWIISKDYL